MKATQPDHGEKDPIMKLKNFFSESPKWHERIGGIHALLERVKMSEEQSGDVLRLRKLNRILSIHASTAIEGNRLTLGQKTSPNYLFCSSLLEDIP